jgi:hypothetical protein
MLRSLIILPNPKCGTQPVLRLKPHALLYQSLRVSSRRLVVDLSVLRANFTGSRRGPRRLTRPCICANPTMPLHINPHETISRQEASSRLSLDMPCPISQVTKLPHYRIQKNSRFQDTDSDIWYVSRAELVANGQSVWNMQDRISDRVDTQPDTRT